MRDSCWKANAAERHGLHHKAVVGILFIGKGSIIKAFYKKLLNSHMKSPFQTFEMRSELGEMPDVLPIGYWLQAKFVWTPNSEFMLLPVCNKVLCDTSMGYSVE